MIDGTSSLSAQQAFNNNLVQHLKQQQQVAPAEIQTVNKASEGSASFGDMVGKLVNDVAEKTAVARDEANKVLLGQTDNIHQSMIAAQESSLAFTMMVEVRNKLMESYKEISRMPV